MKLTACSLIFVFLSLVGCRKPQATGLLELDLVLLDSDTLVLDVGNVLLQNAKATLFNGNKELLVQHGRRFFWIDAADGRILKSLDIDTTDLVLPEVSLVYGQPLEGGKSLALYFPQRSRVVHLDSGFRLAKELSLEGHRQLEHELLPYGENFHFDPEREDYYLGMMSTKAADMEGFLEETRFLGVFDGTSGKLKFSFAGFSPARKSQPSMILSAGIFQMAISSGDFYIRESVGTPLISRYNGLGELMDTARLGTSLLSYELHPYLGGDLWKAEQSDNQMGFALVGEGLVASNYLKFNNDPNNGKGRYDCGVLLLEDLRARKSYSMKIDPFQRLIGGDFAYLYLLRNHPKTDDLVLIRLQYDVLGAELI